VLHLNQKLLRNPCVALDEPVPPEKPLVILGETPLRAGVEEDADGDVSRNCMDYRRAKWERQTGEPLILTALEKLLSLGRLV
jgi:hypothetical protein